MFFGEGPVVDPLGAVHAHLHEELFTLVPVQIGVRAFVERQTHVGEGATPPQTPVTLDVNWGFKGAPAPSPQR